MRVKGVRADNLASAAELILTVLFVAACSSAGSTPGAATSPAASAGPGGSPSPSPVSNELLVRVTYEGGFVAPFTNLAQPPIVAAYADGRIIDQAPVTMEYPGRLVRPLQFRNVGPDGARAIREAAAIAGLTAADATYPAVGIADAPDTVFEVVVEGTRVTTRFGALAEAASVPGGQDASEPARKAAAAFLARLTDPADAFGGPPAPTGPYTPTGYQVWARPGAPDVSDPALAEEPVTWPLTPLASFGKPAPLDGGVAGMRVGAVAGTEAATLRPVVDGATALTPFRSGNGLFTLFVRPLLPDEAPAPKLGP